MTLSEEWRAAPGYPGYEVSSAGRVRSLDRVVQGLRRGHVVPIRRRGGLMKLKTSRRTGYVSVELSGNDVLVHRAVLAAFVGPCPLGKETAHGDGSRSNNRLENLRYATRVENADDRRRHGTLAKGAGIGNAKLTADQVAAIRARAGKTSMAALAREYGVTRQHIGHIHHNRVWL